MGRRSGKPNEDPKWSDPYIESRYGIDLKYGTESIGSFGRLSGGEMETDVIPYSLNDYGGSTTIYIPGTYGYTPLIFTRGVSANMDWWNWWSDITDHKRVTRDLTVYAYGYQQADGTYQQAQWNLSDAWPSKITGLNFNLGSGNVYVASVTLIVEGVTRIT